MFGANAWGEPVAAGAGGPAVGLAAALSGTGTVAADLRAGPTALAAALVGSCLVAAALSAGGAGLACSMTGAGSVSASLTTDVSLVAALSASGAVAASLLAEPAPDTGEPVTLAEAKIAARVDNDLPGGAASSLDAFILGAISTARAQAEQITGRRYRRCVIRTQFSDWPAADESIHVHEPSACSISYWNGAAWVAMDDGAFAFFPLDLGGTGIAPAYGTSWPPLGDIAGGPRVRVDLTAGPTGAVGERPVPECVKTYIKAQVSGWVNNGDFHTSQQMVENALLTYVLDSERLWV